MNFVGKNLDSCSNFISTEETLPRNKFVSIKVETKVETASELESSVYNENSESNIASPKDSQTNSELNYSELSQEDEPTLINKFSNYLSERKMKVMIFIFGLSLLGLSAHFVRRRYFQKTN